MMEILAQFWSKGGLCEVPSRLCDEQGKQLTSAEGSFIQIVNGRLEIRLEDSCSVLGWAVIRLEGVLFFLEAYGTQYSGSFESNVSLVPFTLEMIRERLITREEDLCLAAWATADSKASYEREAEALNGVLKMLVSA